MIGCLFMDNITIFQLMINDAYERIKTSQDIEYIKKELKKIKSWKMQQELRRD